MTGWPPGKASPGSRSPLALKAVFTLALFLTGAGEPMASSDCETGGEQGAAKDTEPSQAWLCLSGHLDPSPHPVDGPKCLLSRTGPPTEQPTAPGQQQAAGRWFLTASC